MIKSLESIIEVGTNSNDDGLNFTLDAFNNVPSALYKDGMMTTFNIGGEERENVKRYCLGSVSAVYLLRSPYTALGAFVN